MATMVPPQKGVEYIFYTGLTSQADTKLLQNNPTLAAGDVLVSTDGGATSNLDTLPAVTPAASDMVKVTVSATEMTGDNIIIVFSDVAGSEWCDKLINIQTSAQSLDTMDTNIDDIETDTAVIGALGAGLTAIPWNSDWDAEVQSECTDALNSYDPPTKTEMDTGHALLATEAKQDIIDTVVDGIQTDLSNATDGLGALKALIDAVQTQVDTTGVELTASAVDDIWDEAITAAAHGVADSAAIYLRQTYQTVVTRVNQCGDAGSASTIDLDASASAVTDFYKGQLIVITAGTGKGQARSCTAYNGTTKVATVSPDWVTAPDGDSWFAIINTGSTIPVTIALTSADITTACGTALATYDAPTKAELDTALAALNDITVAEIIAGIADGSYDLQEMIRIIFAACSGKSDGGGSSTLHFRDSADSTNRITATVDANGNRTAVTLDGS